MKKGQTNYFTILKKFQKFLQEPWYSLYWEKKGKMGLLANLL